MSPKEQQPPKSSSESASVSENIFVVQVGDKTYRFQKKRVVIGSVTSADVRIVGNEIAPIHAVIEIELKEKKARIYDIASDSGILVNGAKQITADVGPNDQIAMGSYQFKISYEKENEGAIPEKIWSSGKQKLFGDPKEDFTPLILESQSQVDEIFDYRPAAKRAVEVVMSWNGMILNIDHFMNKGSITIGSSKESDFSVPPIEGSKNHPIVQFKGGSFVLKRHPSMSGVVQSKGGIQKIEDLPVEIPFGVDDFAKITIRGVDFYISFTAAPPRLKKRLMTDRDPLFRRMLFGSLAFTAFLIWLMFKVEPPQTVEIEQLPDRIATILYQPEKFTSYVKPKVAKAPQKQTNNAKPVPKKKKPPKKVTLDIKPNQQKKLKKIPKELNLAKKTVKKKIKAKKVSAKKSKGPTQTKQRLGNEGAGARAKGASGKRGSKLSKRQGAPQNKASRASTSGRKGQGGGSRSRVNSTGNLSFLKGTGSKIQNLLGSATSGLGKSGSKLKGYGVFNTEGSGGLALSGSGTGGGGNAEGLGGLSNRGRGGGRVGTGLGALGKGGGIIGGKARVVVNTGGGEETVLMGAIDKSAVEAALLAHKDEFRLCYEKEINAETPGLSGRVGTTFVIGPRGRVTRAGIRTSSLKNANVERCIVRVIKRIQFPIPRGGGIVQVNYPFKFRALN